MRRVAKLVMALLRELSDETAYHKYLQSHKLSPSGDAWRKFSEERLRKKYSRAKCC
jgi:hypothetical protein